MAEPFAFPPDSRRNAAGTAGAWRARYRGPVIVGWLVFVVVACLVGSLVGRAI
jgi:hypothetical protein